MPVALPPGRLKLATKPALIGSLWLRKMIGIVRLAALAARNELPPPEECAFEMVAGVLSAWRARYQNP